MKRGDDILNQKLDKRRQENAFRNLRVTTGTVDFCSNDYLGVAKNDLLLYDLDASQNHAHGSTGSRLLSGNYALIEETEAHIATFHEAEAGLIFNSGYDANLGLLSSVPQRGDTILYDFLSHASLRDGIRLSFAQAFPFRHNDLNDLEAKLKTATGNIFVVTESVFSMDGDIAPLQDIDALCDRYGALLVVDEAHATGVVGEKGEGLVQVLALQQKCFARIHTFGKACGVHGAIVLGSSVLKAYLVNFARPFVYTTALPPSAAAAIGASYRVFPAMVKEREQLNQLIHTFTLSRLRFSKLKSETPIQGIIVPGNEAVKNVAAALQKEELDVRPILYPTVPKGEERLRIVLHAFNTPGELEKLVSVLQLES